MSKPQKSSTIWCGMTHLWVCYSNIAFSGDILSKHWLEKGKRLDKIYGKNLKTRLRSDKKITATFHAHSCEYSVNNSQHIPS